MESERGLPGELDTGSISEGGFHVLAATPIRTGKARTAVLAWMRRQATDRGDNLHGLFSFTATVGGRTDGLDANLAISG